ncbi:30S ribosomal protein S5 [Mycoplasma flocculare]|uniref:Small ribosomal subunit protein uS5 n=1 Tax=Mesomycoplasma flocculare TaxID=2128 RepID=A0AAW9XBR7_MESFC|nr:30S ribosomal protein S5 [Mesomycoplasma flocculare]MXR12275.1 30S ribosomal protein S5 [Mesomycoplasma flocculare]MXR39454.1 30S ribosomal protein S5 [Mycoplasma sp. MF12]MXR56237.1 30S ribosomal protein S5 [Mesomycoplasma flocculare]MXR56689.1 30S ribosomal protein S5 [Mesomycoplasma flocculare]
MDNNLEKNLAKSEQKSNIKQDAIVEITENSNTIDLNILTKNTNTKLTGQIPTEIKNESGALIKKIKVNQEHFESSKEQKRTQRPRPQRQKNKDKNFKPEFEDRVVSIARVTKVVKGGRRFSFSAFAVVGNKKGKVGFGHGKANEVQDSIRKAIKDAQNRLVSVPIYRRSTVPHEISAKYSASKILIKPAPRGKGIVASNTVRAVVELAGYTDIYTKTYGSRTKINVVRATLKALLGLKTLNQVAELRDLSPQQAHALKN